MPDTAARRPLPCRGRFLRVATIHNWCSEGRLSHLPCPNLSCRLVHPLWRRVDSRNLSHASSAIRRIAPRLEDTRPLWQKTSRPARPTRLPAPVGQPRPGGRQVYPGFEGVVAGADRGHRPVVAARVDNEEQVIGASRRDAGTETACPWEAQGCALRLPLR